MMTQCTFNAVCRDRADAAWLAFARCAAQQRVHDGLNAGHDNSRVQPLAPVTRARKLFPDLKSQASQSGFSGGGVCSGSSRSYSFTVGTGNGATKSSRSRHSGSRANRSSTCPASEAMINVAGDGVVSVMSAARACED